MADKIDSEEVFKGITNRRWDSICRALDKTFDEVTGDSRLISLVVAHEVNFKSTGKNDWAKFTEMTPLDVAEFLNGGPIEVTEDGTE
jgi:hypothetical protein